MALNIKSHYKLVKRKIEHYTISDLVDFKTYLTHSDKYNEYQKSFFMYCDNFYSQNIINDEVKFAPYKTIAFNIK